MKLSAISAPAVAGVVRARTAREAIAEIKNCTVGGADMIDLHLSCLENTDTDTLRRIIGSTKLPILALNYNTRFDWTPLNLTEEERIDTLLRAVEAGAAGIDIQGYTFHAPSKKEFCGEDRFCFTRGNPKEVVTDPMVIRQQCQLIEKVHAMGAEVLLSCHPGIVMSTGQVVELALFLQERKPDIIKIVTKATNQEDLDESIRSMLALKKALKTPVAYHVNGSAGLPSRLINPLLGGQIAFCVDRYDTGSTMEQLDLRTTRAAVDNAKKVM